MLVHVVGGGLAGSEAAWQLAVRGVNVKLYEMRGVKGTPAHHTSELAELVCSNSFRSDDIITAVGLLHDEMRRLNSLILYCADKSKVPAGSALSVDRDKFSQMVGATIRSNPNVEITHEEITQIPADGKVIIATGPLTGDALTEQIASLADNHKYLSFFDAIAPIVYKDSINFDVAWFQSRYDKGEGKDYINCPLNKQQYYDFIESLLTSDVTQFKEWEKNTPYFDGCLPIEVMAERGKDTLRFGPMKPIGLTNPHSDEKPFAVVQLRQDNELGTLYNIVGFQTKLKYGAQKSIFNAIPGLKQAEFARLGGVHRNTFINSPELLDRQLRHKNAPNIRFAGQITGVEGYLESAACGLLCGIFTAAEMKQNIDLNHPPQTTALGALLSHITGGAKSESFQPMNINYGLFEPLSIKKRGREKKQAYSERAIEQLNSWIAANPIAQGIKISDEI